MKTKTACGFLLLLGAAASPVDADGFAYAGVKDLRASGGNTVAEHHHDWRSHTAFVRVLDAASGRELLNRASPALTTLWVSPDGRFVVGLSSIKIDNPSQLFVLGRDGSYQREEGVRCRDPRLGGLPCMESVTNVVSWYDEERPELELAVQGDQPVTLAVNALPDRGCAGPQGARLDEAEWKRRCAEPRRIRLALKAAQH